MALYIIGGTILSIFPVPIVSIFIARVIFGYCFGLTYLTMIAKCGEISSLWNRGTLISCIQLSFTLGIFIFTMLNAFYKNEILMNLNRIIAGVTIAIAVFSYILNYCLGVESPVFLFQNDKYSEAINLMKKLRNEEHESRDTRYEYEELRLMTLEDSLEGSSIFYQKTFYFILLLKTLVTLTFTNPINFARIFLASKYISNINAVAVQSVLLISVRILTTIFPIVTMDSFGRRIHILWTARLTTLILIVMGILAIIDTWSIVIFLFIYEAVTGFGMHATVDTFSSEIFSTKKKGIGLSFLVCVESIIHLLLSVLAIQVNMSDFYYLIMFFTAIFTLLMGFMEIPETRRLTLREARKRFHRIEFNFKL